MWQGSLPLRISEGAVEVKHALGPLPRVLFEQTEGYIFWVQNRYLSCQVLFCQNQLDPFPYVHSLQRGCILFFEPYQPT